MPEHVFLVKTIWCLGLCIIKPECIQISKQNLLKKLTIESVHKASDKYSNVKIVSVSGPDRTVSRVISRGAADLQTIRTNPDCWRTVITMHVV